MSAGGAGAGPRELPRLHLVTDDRVLAARGFREELRALLAAHGPRLALHLRGHATPGGRLFALAAGAVELAERVAQRTGHLPLILVNDRVDVALAAGAGGVHLGRRSLPVAAVRRLLPADARVGCSVHGASDVGPPAPVLGIGGVTPERVAAVRAAGGWGVAVLGGVWRAADPVAAAARYLDALEGAP
jgi:thiamine monophosphate synthase